MSYAAKAHGILIQLKMFDTFFGLKLPLFIFSSSEQFSLNLQSVDITVKEVLKVAQLLVKYLKSQQNQDFF